MDPERLLRQHETLRQVIEEVSSELALAPLLTGIVRHACELLEAWDGAIGLYDEARGVIRTEAVYRMPEAELGREMAPGVGLAGQVLAGREPVVLDRYGDVPQPVHPELAHHAVVGVPIFWHDRLLGFFGLGARPPRRFDQGDVDILTLFARHAAVAIHNAHLFEQSRRLAVLEERQRLARELHDSVTQLLASATLMAQSLASAFRRDPAAGERRLERMIELNRAALSEMRALLVELSPAEESCPRPPSSEFPPPAVLKVRRLGLAAVLEEHARRLDGLSLDWQADGWEGASPACEETLFRVAQEALANVAKHAAARRVRVRLSRHGAAATLVVEDDGRGFDARQALDGRPDGGAGPCGLGLLSMRARALALGGRFRLESEPGHGTRIEVSVPAAAVEST